MSGLKNAQDLLEAELISPAEKNSLEMLAKTYSIGLTSEVLQTIHTRQTNDPVFKQYVPVLGELNSDKSEDPDPIGDEAHTVTKGLIHRYPDRVLFKITSTCAVYCRFCFRREMVGRGKDALSAQDIENAFDYIRNNQNIREVILSGGDPLILSPRRLKELMVKLEEIDHVQIIRFHTRIPVAQPSIITHDLLDALSHTTKQLVFVIHVNHAQELAPAVEDGFRHLKSRGRLLSQSVLLKGVNNNTQTLLDLMGRLSDLGVQPYYLHHPDKARGTAHFRITITEGQEIYQSLRGKIAGHLLPSYVLDIPGGYGKVPVNTDWIAPHPEGGYSVKDIHGQTHRYYD